jgi:hypothetical protein
LRIDHNSRGRSASRDIDWAAADLAGRQHGRIARWQLRELGLSSRMIDYRIDRHRLHPEHPGVYAFGHPASTRTARWMAAVLAGGRGAALSHWAAASLWGIVAGGPARIDVTSPHRREDRTGLRCHLAQLPADELTVRDGIPLTSPGRTLFDIAADLPMARGAIRPPRRFEAALNQTDVLRLWDGPSLPALLERYPGRPGSRVVRLALRLSDAGATVTRSEFEDRFVEFIDDVGLPRPEINGPLLLDGEWIEIDALWRIERVALELDSRQFHDTPAAFETDRRRDRRLVAAGWRPVRITWRQLTDEPDAVARDLRRMLS